MWKRRNNNQDPGKRYEHSTSNGEGRNFAEPEGNRKRETLAS
jgi:hypothetical protein